ncbi:hypothetical protein HYH03_012855 [Edaphochlamys debaryana]|uniref:Uncharacterized protein n=1 Tax=Edaphochlamys debaryana TaxID=47281 RepID=A0A835XR22_9CHLO|nr:hypothetical protein HYH03_012855 [Edaphochlamys debaryana]|eukprot:KAG2488536.1 hypothetical protein HYH03_012855 [Edaphochlamys debaryana]
MAYFKQSYPCVEEPLPSGAIVPAGSLTAAQPSPFAAFRSAVMAAHEHRPRKVAAAVAGLLQKRAVRHVHTHSEAYFLVVDNPGFTPFVWMLEGVKERSLHDLDYESAAEENGISFDRYFPAEEPTGLLPAVRQAVLEELRRQLVGTGMKAEWTWRYLSFGGSKRSYVDLLCISWKFCEIPLPKLAVCSGAPWTAREEGSMAGG